MICHHDTTPEPVARIMVELLGCCWGAANDGPHCCTCWVPEYDLEQSDPDTTAPAGARETMCGDCAYRPDSPERSGDPRFAHSVSDDDAGPLGLAQSGQPFWCHQGMRKPVRWRHPAGIVIEADKDGYEPPQIDGVPYQADGTPGLLCAGWLAHRLAVVQRGVPR